MLEMHAGLETVGKPQLRKYFGHFLMVGEFLDPCALRFSCAAKPRITGWFYRCLALRASPAKPSTANPHPPHAVLINEKHAA